MASPFDKRELEKELVEACREGRLEQVVNFLVIKGVRVNAKDGYDTPLSVAAERGHVHIMTLLFEHGAKPNFVARHGYWYRSTLQTGTPLMIAAKNGQYEAAELLLQKGAKVDFFTGLCNQTPLELASENGHAKLVKLLLDHGAERQHWPLALKLTCTRGHTECAKVLIEHGVDIDHLDRFHGTPLSCAAENGHTECTKLLLEKGADVHKPSYYYGGPSYYYGGTPLMLASRGGHIADVQLLLEHDLDASNRANALYLACQFNHMEVVEVLIKNGTDVNHIPEKAARILLEMIERKCFNIAQLLIQRINDRSFSSAITLGNPTLMSTLLQNSEEHLIVQMNDDLVQAAVDGDHNLAEVILPHVRDINVRLKSGNTALMEIIERKRFDIAHLLIQNGIKIDVTPFSLTSAIKSRNPTLMSALLQNAEKHLIVQMNGDLVQAAVDGDHNLAEVILPHVRDINVRLKSGNTALMEIIERKRFDITHLLIHNGVKIDVTPCSLTSAIKSRNPTLMSALLQNAEEHLIIQMNDDLVQAAVDGDFNFAEMLLPHVCDINVRLKSGNTALIEATKCRKKEHLKLLLDHGAQVNIKNERGSTALMEAAKFGNVEEVELLLKHDLDASNQANALYLACQHKRIKVVKVLIKNGTDVNHFPEKALQTLLKTTDFDIADFLIQSGVVIDASFFSSVIESRNPTLMSALLQNAEEHLIVQMNGDLVQAAVDGDRNFAEVILPHVRDINIRLKSGNTALTEIIERKRFDIARLLLQNRVKIDVTPFSLTNAITLGNPTLMSALLQNADEHLIVQMNDCDLLQAAVDGDHKFAEVILPHVLDINVRLKSGNTALMEAAKHDKEEHVKLLLDHGAQVNLQSKNGCTALMMASQGGHTKCVQHLVTAKDIDLNMQDNRGCTALMIASKNGRSGVVQTLLEGNTNLDILDANKNSVLFYGVKSNSSKIVEMLLDKGADVQQKTQDGKDILQFAHEVHKKPGRRMIQVIQQAQNDASHKQDVKPSLMKALQLLLSFLLPSAHEWRNIGASLKLPERILNAINGTDQDCLREMLKEWLSHTDLHPTWSSLAKAVEPFNPSIAKQIYEKYCSNKVIPTNKTHQSDEDQDTVEDQKEEDTKESVENLEDSEDESNTENTEDPNNEEHFAAVEKAMTEKGTLKHTLSHGTMVGPARSGKSSLMSRLAGEMPISNSPSTGVAEKVVQVVGVRKSYSIALGVHDTIWFKLLYDQEAIRLMKLTTQNIPSQPQQQLDAPLTDSTTVTPPPTSMQSEPQITTPKAMEQSHEPLSTAEESVTTPFLKDYTDPYPEGYIPPMEVFKAALQGKGLETLRQHFENSWSFYLTDTGGQVEFQELIPLLVSGPSVFFFTFRLDQDLNQRFTIEYHLPDGGRSKPYQSTLTVVEAILQTLASVASMGTFTYKGPQVKSVSLKPKVFIVGTHKDKLDPATADSEIKKIDQHLRKIIEPTSYYQEEIIQFSSESQLIYTVNNFSEDDSDFMRIRSGVERVVFHSEFKVHFPTHWLIFSLVLRQEMIKDSIISYEQCFSIAQDCGIIDNKEFNHALWFLHTKIGLIRHFPTPGLNDFVIRDPQILFDMVTKLIVNTFTFENAVSKPCSTEFEKKGIFTLEDFLALHQESSPLLPPKKLLQLLENLLIVAPFQEEGQDKFFIPCVLAHSEESESQSLPQSSDIPSLLITFKCGYCPKGLAGALIVYFLTNKMGSEFKWELRTDQIFRNQVSFLVSSCDIITLKIHLTFLELIHSSARKTTDSTKGVTRSICNETHLYIQNGIKQVSSAMNFTSNVTCSVTFYCQNSVCNEKYPPHPATKIVKDKHGSVLWCKKSGIVEISDLPVGYSMWLPENSTDHKPPHQLDSNTKPAITSEVSVVSHGHDIRDDMKVADQYETSHPSTSKQFGLTSHPLTTASDSSTSFHHEIHTKPKAVSPDAPPHLHHTTTLEDDKKDVDFNHPRAHQQIGTPLSSLLEKWSDSFGESIIPPVSTEPHCQLLPLVPPKLEVVDHKGKMILGPDDGITINVPPGAVADNDSIRVQIQSFIPSSNDTIVLPQGLKLLSPVYHISTFGKKFQEEIQLSMLHYAKLLTRKDMSELKFLHSTDKTPPYKFTELSGGEFDFDSCTGRVFLKSFCIIAQAGPERISEEYSVYFIHPIPALNSKCMYAMFSACYRHNAFLKYLEDQMKSKFPNAQPFNAAFKHVELAEDSKEFELIIPKEDVKRQGYEVKILGHKTTKISVEHIPPLSSATSADYPIRSPLPFYLLHVKLLQNCTRVGDLKCDLKVDGIKGDEVFVMEAEALATTGLTSHPLTTASDSSTSFQHEIHTKPKAVSPDAPPHLHHTTTLEDDKKDVDFNHPRAPQQIDPTKTLDGCDWAEICRYLNKLDQKHVKRLGGVLGLDIFDLGKMKDLPDDMVEAWLRKEGKVTEKCGDPLTWGVLVKALNEIGQTGIADVIHKDKCVVSA